MRNDPFIYLNLHSGSLNIFYKQFIFVMHYILIFIFLIVLVSYSGPSDQYLCTCIFMELSDIFRNLLKFYVMLRI